MSSPNATSSPISIGWTASSPASSTTSRSSYSSTSSTGSNWNACSFATFAPNLSCAYPSWPTRSSLSSSFGSDRGYTHNDIPNAYISDFDLFPEDLEDESEVPCMEEAPEPPRMAAAMPLAPLYASQRSRSKKRKSPKKSIKLPSMMAPIAESVVSE